MAAYYNEWDAKTAAWLRELIKAGLIADGEVDTRSIELVQPDDLRGFVQCHFFAGIGGWSYALRLAGWPDDRAVWTGSCPCQPFSSAGKGAGGDDARHLWPAWFRLIRECRPVVVFGEQVESALAHGWIDAVFDDLEGEDYAAAPVGLPAACVGAFHGRPRVWFVAHACRQRHERERLLLQRRGPFQDRVEATRSGAVGDLEQPEDIGHRRPAAGRRQAQRRPEHAGIVGNADNARPQGHGGGVEQRADQCASGTPGAVGVMGESDRGREVPIGGVSGGPHAERRRSPWADAEWIACRDGKLRPVEPGTFPLAHGLPARVGRLRGYGNAIVPQVAAEVIAAYMEITQ